MQTTLYYKEGSSDKIYQAALEQRETGYVVTFAYGRRGSTMNAGTKTSSPVAYDAAKSIYDKLVKEKLAKGYSAGEAAVAVLEVLVHFPLAPVAVGVGGEERLGGAAASRAGGRCGGAA